MSEVALMDPSKETDNKLRWHADIDGVDFKVYVPKWRVPVPWPQRILVRIEETTSQNERLVPSGNAKVEALPIFVLVEKNVEHTTTVRYTPSGDPEGWELGEPYIPYPLLPSPPPQRLGIEVEWDWSAGTWSGDG